MSQENVEIVRRVIDAWNRGEQEVSFDDSSSTRPWIATATSNVGMTVAAER